MGLFAWATNGAGCALLLAAADAAPAAEIGTKEVGFSLGGAVLVILGQYVLPWLWRRIGPRLPAVPTPTMPSPAPGPLPSPWQPGVPAPPATPGIPDSSGFLRGLAELRTLLEGLKQVLDGFSVRGTSPPPGDEPPPPSPRSPRPTSPSLKPFSGDAA